MTQLVFKQGTDHPPSKGTETLCIGSFQAPVSAPFVGVTIVFPEALLGVLCLQAWWTSPGRQLSFSMRRMAASPETFIFPPLRTLKTKQTSSQLTKFEKVLLLLPPFSVCDIAFERSSCWFP